jgi:hypothetical protein
MTPAGFFIGLHQPSDGKHFEQACISINRLRGPKGRKAPLPASLKRVLIDSAAFTELHIHGHYRHDVREYADAAAPWCRDGRVVAIVAQDYMCEPFMLAKTGLSVAEHQRLTIERYDALAAYWFGELRQTTPILPVLQGYTVADYVAHLRAYGDRLTPGMWVGVGSVCKRQGDPKAIVAILRAIKAERPDLRLHGFGVKLTALNDPEVRDLLETADSTAWSYSARKQGRSANDYREAQAFVAKVEKLAA